MQQTKTFKGQATPSVINGFINALALRILIVHRIILHEFEIEKCELVDELEDSTFVFPSNTFVFSYGAAIFKVIQHDADITVIWYLTFCNNFGTSHADLFLAKSFDNGYVFLWSLELRSIEFRKLIFQFTVLREE